MKTTSASQLQRGSDGGLLLASTQPLPAPNQVLGIKPWLPWPLSRWNWLTQPIRAERLAAFRIGLALVTLVDLLLTVIPNAGHFLNPQGIWLPLLRPWYLDDYSLRWSLLKTETDVTGVQTVLWIWAGALLCLLVGFFTRLSAVLCWLLAVSVGNVMTHVDNAGDTVRVLFLFYLMFCPSGAAWSFDNWWRRRYRWDVSASTFSLERRSEVDREPYYVYPWAVRLITFQLCILYFFNGLYKFSGEGWHKGDSLYYALGDLGLTRVSLAQFRFPIWMLRWGNWTVLYFELLFPLIISIPWKWLAESVESLPWKGLRWTYVLFRWNRESVLILGVGLHLGIATLMEIGGFSFYVLCAYLPMVPWEVVGKKPNDPYQALPSLGEQGE